jgi:hypothetical protein
VLGAFASNMAVQHSGDPLQDLVGEPGIVDGTSQRDRADQRGQHEMGIVPIADVSRSRCSSTLAR